MGKQILITGGAGFVGSHLADELLGKGHLVRALDNLSPQVHGPHATRPAYLDPEVELMIGDVRDPASCRRALAGVDVVYHLAATVGVGQSMYEITRYTGTNNLGTATLLEALIQKPVEKLIVASSMSVYGEGLYRDGRGAHVTSAERSLEQLRTGQWDLVDATGESLVPVATPESKTPALASVYALSKYDQERLCLLVGRAYRIPTVALRFFNIYGPRQALSNPYTGVLAIFSSRLLNGRPPLVNEDGLQRRDFISVYDAVAACRRALEADTGPEAVLNIGSGRWYTVLEIAERAARALGRPNVRPAVTGNFRVGDIRHCYADIRQAQRLLDWQPHVSLEQGLHELASSLEGARADDRIEMARDELVARGLAL